ncbi:LysM peptidoglycan-binding domain-containing protein [Radiobacillus sp. PE A8.2]|uniref:LysM peptidoglycan-binding domain-containing protein n=1 Tax=Radiobacillus sp. PE A8.2 TaxID=3380349 RepID=UPI00388E7CC6
MIIPQALHTVKTGDYLTVLARDYNVSVDGIKQANGLKTDSTKLGQTLIITAFIQSNQSLPTAPKPEAQPSSYIAASGDSLSVIAKRMIRL